MKPKLARSRIQVSRSFSKSQWAFLQRQAADLPADDPSSPRVQFPVALRVFDGPACLRTGAGHGGGSAPRRPAR
ncbi:hypothetical protein ACTMU2_17060 [Cupriavidus basilensis]